MITARRLFEQALSIYEASLGSNHPIVAADLFNLAYMLQGQEETDAAQAMNQLALSITEAAMGPNHPSVAIGVRTISPT